VALAVLGWTLVVVAFLRLNLGAAGQLRARARNRRFDVPATRARVGARLEQRPLFSEQQTADSEAGLGRHWVRAGSSGPSSSRTTLSEHNPRIETPRPRSASLETGRLPF
jgi:hypothetical protein